PRAPRRRAPRPCDAALRTACRARSRGRRSRAWRRTRIAPETTSARSPHCTARCARATPAGLLSVCEYPGLLDDRAPLADLGLEQVAERPGVRLGQRHRLGGEIGEARAECGR